MTYATVATSGRGRLVFWLRIAGNPYVFGTANLTPNTADTWYWDGASPRFYGVLPWMSYSGLVLDETADLVDGTLDVGPLDVEIVDVAGGFTSLYGASQYRNFTRLAADLAAGGATITADSTTGFSAAGVLWLDQECITYTGLAAGPPRFTGCSRGIFGTIDAAHYVNTAAVPAILPIITDGPTVLGGRRANLYAAEVVDGAATAGECVFRGLVAPDCDAGEGVYRLRIDHIASMWSRKVGQQLPIGVLQQGYSYTGGVLSTVVASQDEISTATTTTADCDLTPGYYKQGELLAEVMVDLSVGQFTAGFTRLFLLNFRDGHDRVCLVSLNAADYRVRVTVVEGDYLWALGFDPGDYVAEPAVGGEAIYEAQNGPRMYVGEVADPVSSTAAMEAVVTGDPGIETGQWATMGRNSALLVGASSAYGDGDTLIEFAYGCDPARRVAFVYVDDEKDLVIQNVVFASGAGETLLTAAQKFLGVYGGTSFPSTWVVEGLEADDFEWTELTAALVGTPLELQSYYACVKEPITVGELICDRLGLCGIMPRITTQGRIGFARVQTPHEVLADSVEIDSSMWSLVSAAKVKTAIEGVPRLSRVKVETGHDYRTGEWGQPITVLVDGVNNLGKTISKDYLARGLITSTSIGAGVVYADFAQLLEGLKNKLVGVHLGLLGRGGPIVSIACTWTSRQLMIGDIVKITHPCIHDVAGGAVGVTDRLGIVVGRTLQLTDQGEDSLRVLLPAEQNAGAISPCALGTGWNAGLLRLSFAATNLFCQAGENDLTYFDSGQMVLCTEYDDAAPTVWGPVDTDDIDRVAGWIQFTADPFLGAFPAGGVYMHFANYDSCGPSQKEWLFMGDTAYSLGAAGDPCYVWAI